MTDPVRERLRRDAGALREHGLTYELIGRLLGVSKSRAYRWVNGERPRRRVVSSAGRATTGVRLLIRSKRETVYVIVDECDRELVASFPWYVDDAGYVRRSVR